MDRIGRHEIRLIADCLKSGKVIAYPADTVYGLGCDARDALAIRRINKIKSRGTSKPLLVLVSGFKMLEKYCFVNSAQIRYLKTVWPGPVTAVLHGRKNLPPVLTGASGGLAARFPKSDFLVRVIKKCGFPIVSTSLNKRGGKTLSGVKNLAKHFRYLPDLAVDAGECGKIKPSRLVDLRDMKNIMILRN